MLEPENSEYLLVLGEAEYKLGQINEAEEIYKRLLDADPTMMEAWLDWSFIKFSLNDLDAAIDLLREALKIEPDCHQYLYRIANYLYAKGENKEATLHLETALILFFDDHFLLFEISPELKNNAAVINLIELYKK
jgi:tetratricopeptide (TPR) repeat protein